jgi:hypothetical protein
MNFPINDWQFWVATAIAAACAWAIAAPLLPSRRKAPSCPGCPSGESRGGRSQRPATLTIGGERPR